jgi:DNA helicase-2/ATP-dependent DNA helicase PcrA
LDHLEAGGHELKSLGAFDAPQPVKMEWKRFCEFFGKLADPATPWAGQVGAVRAWYKPQMERIYDAAWTRMGDLEQLEQLSSNQPSRERFLSELTLDPPSVTSDQAGAASKDDDYVILSTIHSAKGQEWDHVYVLNVSDGNFPSEFSTGKPELIEEERRLLYVAMTRARNELHLCAPLKYQVTQQPRLGDKHVYGAKSRFMTDKVMDTCERVSVRTTVGVENLQANGAATVDVGARLKEMW